MNYTQNKTNSASNSCTYIDNSLKPLIPFEKKLCDHTYLSSKKVEQESFALCDTSSALLVNTEVCCENGNKSLETPKNRLPNYVGKFVRKHTASYCMTNDGIEKNEDKVLRKFSTRLVSCNSKINDFLEPKTVDIKEQKHENGKSRHIHGTIKCGSPWICPSCSATLSMARGEQLSHLVECGRENGRGYGMAVLTVRHKPGQPLKDLQDILEDVWRRTSQSTPFREWKKQENIRFTHRGYEIMASIKNGKSDWHPHYNIIFDYDEMELMSEEDKIKYEFKTAKFLWSIFNKYAKKYHGITLQEPFLQEVQKQYQGNNGTFTKSHIQVKGGVSFNLDFIEEYTTKFGLVEEATAGMYKVGNGSFHPFQILDMIRKEDETMSKNEKILLIRMFREYALATKGKSFFRFGRGSVQYYQDNYSLDLQILDDESEIQNREAKGNIIYSVELKLWNLFKPSSLHIAELLSKETSQDMEDYILKIINERLRE